MPKQRRIFITIGLLLCALALMGGLRDAYAATPLHGVLAETKQNTLLSSHWPEGVQRWASLIYKMAYVNGLDPDFVAAVVMAESNGDPNGVSYAGAVGLMGVMPAGSAPGLEFRPSGDELTDPNTNLSWGVAILTDIIQQSGGDVFAALSAYNGGWPNAGRSVPQQYAAEVLDEYARAVLVRNGLDPDVAEQWTIAIEMRRGYVPTESLLVLGEQSAVGHTYSPHVLYDYINDEGISYHIKGYAVPIGPLALEQPADETVVVSVPAKSESESTQSTTSSVDKADSRNPRIVLTCLATSTRLRGQEKKNTRWFSPSSCPEWRQP